ncbi:MAG: DUF302 domain-containing protein [Pseudomonadota bacterium]
MPIRAFLLATSLSFGLVWALPASAAKEDKAASLAQIKAPAGVYKVALAPGVSLDDAVESMKLRANIRNIKLVAELPLSKQVEAMTGEHQRRMAIYQFCDALTGKELVDHRMEMVVFMPCRVSLIEDEKGQGWLIMMDVDVNYLSKSERFSPELSDKIKEVRASLIDIMNAGAKGEI